MTTTTIDNLRIIEKAIAKNDGKPVPENSVSNVKSLKMRGFVATGSSNNGRVAWLTDKGKIELEDSVS